MFFRPGKKDVNPKERAIWGDLMALGMVFPIAIALGFFIGRWIGGLLGHPRAGMLVGLVWGVAAGFWELYKVTVRLNRLDDGDNSGRDKKDGGGDDDRGH
ncbi:MAG: AtpZ/AtpI family protein [Holophaga sp.]